MGEKKSHFLEYFALIYMHCHFSGLLTLSELKESAVLSIPRLPDAHMNQLLLHVLFYSYDCQPARFSRRETIRRVCPSSVSNHEWQAGEEVVKEERRGRKCGGEGAENTEGKGERRRCNRKKGRGAVVFALVVGQCCHEMFPLWTVNQTALSLSVSHSVCPLSPFLSALLFISSLLLSSLKQSPPLFRPSACSM